MNRRQILFAGAGFLSAQSRQLTAGEVIDRIRKNVGVPWRSQTVDTFKAGGPDTPVEGIATTMMATLDVVQRSAAAGRNLIITHEPTFYSHQDATAELAQDPTYQFKADFLRRHNMAVFRFHDHWHARRPDGIAAGMMQELHWESHVDPQDPHAYVFPSIPLERLARDLKQRLQIRTMRIVGDPKLKISRVQTSWGSTALASGIASLSRPEVDAMIVGETREWELVEYAQDTISSGKNKALLILGHVVSEQAGMKLCATWLKTFIPEVPIDFIPAPEPFWTV